MKELKITSQFKKDLKKYSIYSIYRIPFHPDASVPNPLDFHNNHLYQN